jgi:hypothetical protein
VQQLAIEETKSRSMQTKRVQASNSQSDDFDLGMVLMRGYSNNVMISTGCMPYSCPRNDSECFPSTIFLVADKVHPDWNDIS